MTVDFLEAVKVIVGCFLVAMGAEVVVFLAILFGFVDPADYENWDEF